MNGNALCLAFLVFGLSSCSHPPDNDTVWTPEQYGLTSVLRCDSQVTEAIAEANRIFEPRLNLYLSYHNCGSPAAPHSVAIFVVDSDSLPDSGFAITPEGCECIFLSSNAKRSVREYFGTSSATTLDVSTAHALALLLLHETGHIVFRGSRAVGALPKPPFEMNPDKLEEANADAFAANQLAVALRSSNTSHYTEVVGVNLVLQDISWNLQEKRLGEHFGSSFSPSTFADKKGHHPNLELRFLLMNYYLNPSATQLSLIKSFLVHRDEPESHVFFTK